MTRDLLPENMLGRALAERIFTFTILMVRLALRS
jgi:hypothetical protein